MPQKRFGGKHTAEKLDKLEAYLKPYVLVFKNQSLKTIYFDAFAGTGEIPSAPGGLLFEGEDYEPFITGSRKGTAVEGEVCALHFRREVSKEGA
jgi:hypothetical protein